MRTLRFLSALTTTALKVSVAHRGAFLMQAAFMVLNNLLFLTTWWILFARFDHVAGYRMPDMLLLFGVSAGGFGLAIVLCGGMLELARAISDGDLDALLAQPKSVLLRAIASRSVASGWGDFASGLLLIALSGTPHSCFALLAMLMAAVAFVATGCVAGSVAFWLGRADSLARSLLDVTITFTLYPPGLFGAGIKILLFTVLPAGVIAYLPIELVRAPSVEAFGAAAGAVIAYAGFASCVFAAGLRRYESGSRFGALG
jgi:ABC-2 type transport system permease protein